MKKILTILYFLYDKKNSLEKNSILNFGSLEISVAKAEYNTAKCIDLYTSDYHSISIFMDQKTNILYYTNRSRLETVEFKNLNVILDVISDLNLSEEKIDMTKLILSHGRFFTENNDISDSDIFGGIIFDRIDDFYFTIRNQSKDLS